MILNYSQKSPYGLFTLFKWLWTLYFLNTVPQYNTKMALCGRVLVVFVIIFQELIQNAEDAGATQVKFLHDKHSYGTDKLYNEDLVKFQVSPSQFLLIFNLTIMPVHEFRRWTISHCLSNLSFFELLSPPLNHLRPSLTFRPSAFKPCAFL